MRIINASRVVHTSMVFNGLKRCWHTIATAETNIEMTKRCPGHLKAI